MLGSGWQAFWYSSQFCSAFPAQGRRCLCGCPGEKLSVARDFSLFPWLTARALLKQLMLFLHSSSVLSLAEPVKKQTWDQLTDTGTWICLTSLTSMMSASSEMLKFAIGAQPHSFLGKLLSWVLGRLSAALPGKAFIAQSSFHQVIDINRTEGTPFNY